MRFLRASLLLLFGICLTAIAGCKEEDEIRQEPVVHPDRQAIKLRAGAIQRDDVIWFFLIKGPKDEVAKHVDEFNAFVRSAKFIEKKDEKGRKYEDAEWAAPKGWRKDPPGGMRYAAYRIDAKPKELEVTVTRLPAGDDWQLTNYNRWKKMVNTPQAHARAELKAPEFVEEKDVTWFDLDGLGVHIVSKPPEPMAANKKRIQFPVGVQKQPKQGGGGAKLPFKYVVPDGWEKGELTGQFMVERYLVGKDVQVTLTPLGGGDVAGNVHRWRKEIGLPPISDAAANESAAVLKIADAKSYYVDIDNPGESKRLLGVIVPLDRTIWVVKMWGPSNPVGQYKNSFETFVKSFKLDAR